MYVYMYVWVMYGVVYTLTLCSYSTDLSYIWPVYLVINTQTFFAEHRQDLSICMYVCMYADLISEIAINVVSIFLCLLLLL